jgi:hypothetical protein
MGRLRKFQRRSSTHPRTSVDVSAQPLRAPRANRGFGTDEKRIRTETTVLDKSKIGSGLSLSKTTDCARTAFRPCAIGGPRGRVAVRASSNAAARCIVLRPSMSAQPLRAPRANRGFGTDQKRIRTETTVLDKSKIGSSLSLS